MKIIIKQKTIPCDIVDNGITIVTSGGTTVGDMTKSVYDTNDNGIVDNAEKVNDHTVETDVPAGAVFTDTIYDDTHVLKDSDIGSTVQPYNGSTVIDPNYVHTDNNYTDADKNSLAIKVSSDTTGIIGASQITNMVSISQADYDALTPDANTLYVIGA